MKEILQMIKYIGHEEWEDTVNNKKNNGDWMDD